MLTLNLNGSIALVTGGSGELGRVMCRTLADCGADIAIHYHSNAQQAESLAAEIRALGRRAVTVQADITDRASVFAMQQTVQSALGAPDILVHNAVIQYEWKSVLEQPAEDYDSQYRSCVMQSVYMAQAFVPQMIERKAGRIVVINTECAALAEANCSAYTAAKRGLDGVVRCLAKEVGPYNITVNQVAPGWTITERDRINGTEQQPGYEASIPLRRRGTDQEIANMVAFLASPLAGFTTGAYIPVSGGRVMPSI